MNNYRILEHTADAGLIVRGSTKKELVKNAAFGICSYLNIKTSRKTKNFAVKISASDIESLLVKWLNEILFIIYYKKAVPSKIEIWRFSDNLIRADIKAECFENKNHPKKEIKAVTYHELGVKKLKKGYSAAFIFDI